MHRINQNHSGSLIRILAREDARVESAEGRPDQRIGISDAGVFEQSMQFPDHLPAMRRRRAGFAPAYARPVVRTDSGEFGYFSLYRPPDEHRVIEAGIQHDRRAAGSGTVDV